MKKLVFGISFIVFLLCSSYVFAQIDGGMKKGQKSDKPHGQMMEQGGMMGEMMGMSNQMSEMMGRMSGMMKDIPKDHMKMMSGVMKDMSNQMMEMSTAMGHGRVSAKEMKKMHERMTDIQKRMSVMEVHK